MGSGAVNDRLWKIADRVTGASGQVFTNFPGPPFDISKPTLHDSKSDFQAEMDYLKQLSSSLKDAISILRPALVEDEERHVLASRVAGVINEAADQRISRKSVRNAIGLAVLSAAKCGLMGSTAYVLHALNLEVSDRIRELESQGQIHWSSKGRPPNLYARAIALRFARFIARKTGKYPTFGTASDGSHPSTDYGRALQEVFEILEIVAAVKGPATWAISQLTEDDLKPDIGGLLGSLLGHSPERNDGQDAKAAIAAMLAKKNEP